MCGILGRLSLEGAIGDTESLCDATNRLRHRGPDSGAWWSEGPFFLGHRRLSIIDLEHGGQPMASVDGRFVIAFNGEIYNFVELRAELAARGACFATNSDTEVILHGYQAWGTGVARRLIGMFALAIADRAEQSLYLARDRFGEKPLFVHESSLAISFASELGALAALPDVDRAIDPTALGEYLCLNYVPGNRSLMAGIRRLAPATWQLYKGRRISEERYWTPPAADDIVKDDGDDALRALTERIDDAVRITLRSDVPVALFLSGGIDSSVIAESAVRQGRLRHAYCVDFAESTFSEWDRASAVARTLGLELRRVVLGESALSDFFAIVEHADDPLADSSALAVWTLSREVARDYKVAISGDGGDELFAGYLTYKATLYHSLFIRRMPTIARRALRALASRLRVAGGKVSPSYKLMRFLRAAELRSAEAHFSWNGGWLPEDAVRMLTNDAAATSARHALREISERHALSDNPSLRALQLADASDYLPNDILAKVDRMTMAHGLEARAPFLVPSVAEYAFRLPDEFKMTLTGAPKRILREHATRLFGNGIGAAKKQGFSIPIHAWLRGPARELVEDLLSRRALADVSMLDSDAIIEAKELHMRDRAQYGFELWTMMVLVAWHRARVASPLALRRPAELRRLVIPMMPGGDRSDRLAAAI